MNWDVSHALDYHEKTKHSYISVRTGRYFLDWRNKPYPFKVYLNLPKVNLPREFPKPSTDALTALEQRGVHEPGVDMDKIVEILFFSAGITRKIAFPGEVFYFRAAPATGALYETELYLVAWDVKGLEPGVYHFDPGEFTLTKLRTGDYRSYLAEVVHEDIKHHECAVVFSSIAWRNAWKYEARSYRHWFWDGGVIAANMLAVASAEKIEASLYMGFVDRSLNKLIGVDGRREAAIAVVALGHTQNLGREERTEVTEIRPEVMPLSRKEVEYPEIYNMHAVSSLNSIDELREWRSKCCGATEWKKKERENTQNIILSKPTVESYPLYKVILKRGSTRRFSHKPITENQLSTILDRAFTYIPADFLKAVDSHVEAYLIINAVEGLEPGAYYYDSSGHSLVVLKRGEFRRAAGYLCLEQELASDASVVFFLMTDLDNILRLCGNRGYRLCQFEAGVRAGKIYLSAYALGLGATGLTFYDDDVTQFFQPHAGDKSNMLVVAVGVPAYKSKSGRIIVGKVKHPVG